jgi:LmbE family N-acetylglucosaminyl deacetylase
MASTLEILDPDRMDAGRVLAIGAHPDDCEFYAGATLARLAAAGAQVTCCVVTDGRRGSVDARDMAPVRAEEQPAAFAALGVGEFMNLGYPDGELERTPELVAKLVAVIRRVRPDLVFTHDPRTRFTFVGDLTQLGHSDHRATGLSVLDAIGPRSGFATFHPEQLDEPGMTVWSPREIWLFDSADPTVAVEAGEAASAKTAALRAHASQNERDALVRWAARRGEESFVRLVLRRRRNPPGAAPA